MASRPATPGPIRKRGRPAGKNRAPLSQEERRARNAQYERERRNENAVAMAALAETIGCGPEVTNAELIARVVNFIQQASYVEKSDDIETLRRCNASLMMQIQTLEQRLALDPQYDAVTPTSSNYSEDETPMRTHSNNVKTEEWNNEEVVKNENTHDSTLESTVDTSPEYILPEIVDNDAAFQTEMPTNPSNEPHAWTTTEQADVKDNAGIMDFFHNYSIEQLIMEYL